MQKGTNVAGPIKPPYGPKTGGTTGTPTGPRQAAVTPTERRKTVPAGSRRAKPTSARKTSIYARRKAPGRKAPPPASEAYAAAEEKAVPMVNELREEFAGRLTREEWERLGRKISSTLIPKLKPGRRRKPQVTAALADWKAGMRGAALFRKHIPGWKDHNRYHRIREQKTLMDAIRSRYRREPDHP